LLVGVQELVFIRLEELQKEKNAVLVRAPAHVVAVFNCSLFPHDITLGKDTGNQAKSAGRCKHNYNHRFYQILSRVPFFRDFAGPDKKLRVCDVCGSYLSIFDSDK
jgi:hypothetical protein